MSPLAQTVYKASGLVSLGLVLLLAHPPPAEAHAVNIKRASSSAPSASAGYVAAPPAAGGRERLSINADWRFSRFEENPDGLSYDDMKDWILPSANDFIVNGDKHERPSGTPPGGDVPYVQATFDDSEWEAVNLPHDWAIKGPFHAPGIPNSMGALPINGVGWYRKTLTVEPGDVGKSIFLDLDGAMSNAAVWVNGEFVGGWPYGYTSFRLDLTSYLKEGDNTLAIRMDNPLNFSRWYPGAGLYRNVWLVKVDPIHIAQYGTYITTPSVSAESADVDIVVEIENQSNETREVEVTTEIYVLDTTSRQPTGESVAAFSPATASVEGGSKQSVNASVSIANPQLWGPPPGQTPNLYVAVTTLSSAAAGNGSAAAAVIDTYSTPFGIRTITYSGETGISVNGQRVRIQGTDNHHDHGAIGAAFHWRAAERQLQTLAEMGCNALRMSHNPPAPELLELADQLGFLVMDEIFDVWYQQKISDDYHLYFADWHEPDLRNLVRRDRNHPSVIAWSFGNEIVEQKEASSGAIAQELHDIIASEDATRRSGAAMNNAGPNSTFAAALDLEGLNYQGEGRGESIWESAFPGFHAAFPDRVLWSTESASAVSTRGTYLFPVTSANSTDVGDEAGAGGDSADLIVSAYELYAVNWGATADKVFWQQDKYPYVAGEFVWTGWDYIGEPTPYDDDARSSYFGIIDLAGFKKDRFYIYQARWRSDLPMAHILPHWTWPDRVGEVTPVHVFTAADEAELFVNGESAGRQQRASASSYRFRWDEVTYAPGELRVVAYRDGAEWATETVVTAGAAAALTATADRDALAADGRDLAFVTVAVVDADGNPVPGASDSITFSIEGPGEIIATDNGDPADFVEFPSLTRDAFSGLALAVVRTRADQIGLITVSVAAEGLEGTTIMLQAS
ncbi:hypothetical protein SLS62_000663 [Diatrype stigma]|uniref:Beta-galactosidase n=1 Tax=Diatrype stigma TaxID=117547 RepID=A0AAN9YU60_9PEZI